MNKNMTKAIHGYYESKKACDLIAKELPDFIDLYYDADCDFISESEPQGFYENDEWIEPMFDEIYYIGPKESKRVILGELSDYV